jgi:hypothetical protein
MSAYNFIDLTGQKFGRLTVLKQNGRSKNGQALKWDCLCDCGNKTNVAGVSLRQGLTKSCGCFRNELSSKNNFIDLAGRKFGKLTVVSLKKVIAGAGRIWTCQCECGNINLVRTGYLLSGHTKSCGCLARESASNRAKHNGVKGGKRSRLYNIWINIKQRCENPNIPNFTLYGGRKIIMCEEWHDFGSFQKWSFSNGYTDRLTIDRIDGNGNYEPTNCRWVNQKVQQNNRRNNRIINFEGKAYTLARLAEKSNLLPDTLRRRIDKYGWSLDDAVKTPARTYIDYATKQ